MTTLRDIIQYLKKKSAVKCQPSMDGSRERYYEGKKDAYLDCAEILEKYLSQSSSDKL